MKLHRHSIAENHGRRTWLHVYDSAENELVEVSLEVWWWKGAQHTGIGVELDCEQNGVRLFAGLNRVACGWLTFGSWPLSKWWQRRSGRLLVDRDRVVASVRVHDAAVWWQVWRDPWSWERGIPKWRDGQLWLHDLVLGKPTVTTSPLVKMPLQFNMPEGPYRCTVSLEHRTVRRPRWPSKVTTTYVVDEIEGGYFPVPGNPESDFYVGPDGLFALSGTVPAGTLIGMEHWAVARQVRDRVVGLRRRRGAPDDYAERIA